MAFFSKLGNILKQSVSKQVTSQFSASNPSIYQALRCMSSSKVFVGGLPWAVDDTSLKEAFSQYGEVVEARVIIDREQNRSRGFGFVTFASSEEASSAITAMDGQDLHGRRIKVNYATDRAPRPFGSGGYGGGGYGGGGYGGGQNYGGGYGGGQNYGGGYGGGQNYGGGYGEGAPAVGQYGGGNGIYGSSVAGEAGSGFASSGFEGAGLGSAGSDQFGSDEVAIGAGIDNAGDDVPGEPGTSRDEEEADDYAKRA